MWLTNGKYRVRYGLTIVLGGLTLWSGGAEVVSGQTVPAVTDTNLIIIATRQEDAIQSDADKARKMKADSDVNKDAAKSLRDACAAKIDVVKKEIELLDKRGDLAKKEKRDADAAALELEKKAKERSKDLMERQRDLRDAEMDAAAARVEYAESCAKAYDLESQLMKKRLELSKSLGGGSSDVPLATLQQALRELESRTLKAQLEMADKQQNAAEKEKNVIKRRLQLFEVQSTPVQR